MAQGTQTRQPRSEKTESNQAGRRSEPALDGGGQAHADQAAEEGPLREITCPCEPPRRAVTFRRPFILPELEGPRPAGTYRLVTDEEEISGLSFLAFRRIGTMLRLPSLATSGSRNR